jgi:hypothetical protein
VRAFGMYKGISHGHGMISGTNSKNVTPAASQMQTKTKI